MLEAARQARAYAEGRSRQDLETDGLLALGIVRLLEIISEAAKPIGKELRRECPSIPWQAIVGTRDRLIHGYFDVDLDIV